MRNSGDRGRLRRYQPGSAHCSSFHCHYKKFGPTKETREKKIETQNAFKGLENPLYLLYNRKKDTGSDSEVRDVRVQTVHTSYWLIPVGTNSGALAESRDVLAMESTSLSLLAAGGGLLPLAFCRGLFGFFAS